MSYQVIARKWRPQTFSDIVGQEHVVTTLRNALTSGRIHHAFLFTGIRGIGKTTAARVLAKALNCVNGPTADPCNACEACREITEGRSLDVKEIDGASNRGIDNIRELREGVAFASTRDRYKVYIIDEVHMLTNEAFNALLKTLEEPPSHVVFIFATTELHKVPATIASRCQVFEFRRAALPMLAEHLGRIAAAEGVAIEPDALRLIAREADGSVRDACSLLDQVISFAGMQVGAADVAGVLRTGNRGLFERLLGAVLASDASASLKAFVETQDRGLPARQVLGDLARFLSECMRVVLLGRQAALETGLTEIEVGQMADLVGGRPPEFLAVLLNLLVDAADRAADSRSPDLVAQAAIVQASRMDALSAVEGMIARLEALSQGQVAGRPTAGNAMPPPAANPAFRGASASPPAAVPHANVPPPSRPARPAPAAGTAAQAAALLQSLAG
ncbi:MAG TPA: DNA polymerase III subunit gamma/tau, partial [Myxococcota bacterium]|nr:DNA polymerase III subunit gamma/tau [Myxococcota bacterium]